MTIDQAIKEWSSKSRRMGCVATAAWFCKRVEGFEPKRITRYTKEGDIFEHVVAANGHIYIDLNAMNDAPSY